MCTAISFKVKDNYFGRNLDLYYNYNEQVTVTPRNFPFRFRMAKSLETHYAIIGMATVMEGFPLYYDATNEKGLSIAALNFPQNAVYYPPVKDRINISPFELIPFLLGSFKNVDEVEKALPNINLADIAFSGSLPLSPLHWLVSDKERSLVLEPRKDGLKVFENPVGVLTNNPPFEMQMMYLQNFSNLTVSNPQQSFSPVIKSKPYSLGLGGVGLPGDMSSPSRFVRAAFVKLNSVCDEDEASAVEQFFHILGSVEQPKGVTKTESGEYEYTLYSSCVNTDKGIYYYTTYNNRSITAVNMHSQNLNAKSLIAFNLKKKTKKP